MSGPHPEAVGSYGAEAAEWLAAEAGLDLRWWQRLVLVRALEHDADGDLVWLEVLLSTARQVGKSVGIRGLATWRIHQAERFGEDQLVLHTGKDLASCKEVMRPARVWARGRPGYKVREANGAEEIAVGDSRWLIRARFSVYSYAVSVGLVDEAWRVDPDVVEDGVEPTMANRANPQLWLVSTAHRKATSLYPLRRTAALASLTDPGSTLVVEWSAPRSASVEDREAWRLASPFWTKQRERLLDSKLSRVLAGVSEDPDEDDPVEAFRAQFLNIWPVRRLIPAGEEFLVEAPVWEAATSIEVGVPPGPIVVGVEDWYGRGAAACAAAVLPDGRFLIWGDVFPDRDSAVAWAGFTVEGREGSGIVAGASLPVESIREAIPGVAVSKGTAADVKAGLPLLRVLLRQGRVVHGGEASLTDQVRSARVVEREGGLVIPHRATRVDLVRALTWALHSTVTGGVAPLPRPAIF